MVCFCGVRNGGVESSVSKVPRGESLRDAHEPFHSTAAIVSTEYIDVYRCVAHVLNAYNMHIAF